MVKHILILVFLTAFCSSCLKNEPFKMDYSGYEPELINDDWIVSTPDEEKIDRAKLEQAYQLLHDDTRFWMARSLLVVRNGKLVAEDYPHDIADREMIANIQSCSKSVTSIMVGIAIQNGVNISIDEKLYDIYPELFDTDTSKRDITIKDALTMRTGLNFNNDVNTLGLYQTKSNSAGFVLSFDKMYKSGTVMNYNDGAPQLVSKALEKKTGKKLSDYANEMLFNPLNITDWKWEYAHDGTTFGAFSLYLKPRDFAKIGQLLLQNGEWDERQIINHDYLKAATSINVSSESEKPYGFYFWIDQKNGGYCALGHGGQILLVVPSKNLVFLYTAWPYSSGDYFDDALELMNIIIEGCS